MKRYTWWALMVLTVTLAGCMKGDECAGIQTLGGLLGLGPQPMVDDTISGKRLWFWVDAAYPSLTKADRVLYTDSVTGFSLAEVEDTRDVTNQPIQVGIGANIGVDPARAAENYEEWSCRYYVYGWQSALPVGDVEVKCPVLRTGTNNRTVADQTCRKRLITDRAIRGYSTEATRCYWRATAWTGPWPAELPAPPYMRSIDDARDAFNALALKAGYPVTPKAIVARSIVDVVADQRNSPGCTAGKGEPGKAPPPQSSEPPGAETPDGGGILIPPGTTPGGGAGSGDYP